MFECSFFQWTTIPRKFFLPLKPLLNASALGLLDDNEYAEVSTRFKGSHVKRMLWRVAMKSQISAEAFPHVFFEAKGKDCFSCPWVKPNSVDPLLCFDDQCLLFICYVLEHFLASDGKF